MYTCPENHASDSPDFCSVCGVEIPGGATAVAAAPAAAEAGASGRCPDCDTPRDGPAQVFCEVCGYNFRTGAAGVPGAPAPAAPEQPAPPPEAPAPDPAAPPSRWDVVVEVDDCLYGAKDAAAPVGRPRQTFTLFDDENLIGRAGTEVRVQVPVAQDHGVSRRQAVLVRRPDGSLILRDLGSTNGTQVNGVEVTPGVDVPVGDGDRIAVGAWTRITVRAV
jgi:hypothetical protein